ncbi:MAG: M28 family peptidase [Bacteroidota bacterium]|nr:M28 family peptidase [Bacteroidota bacterium]
MTISTKTVCLFLLLPNLVGAQDTSAIRYSTTITSGGMSKNLHVLASDEYEGRETGKKGQKMAAEYIANQFMAAGIPSINGSYYQQFPLNVIQPSMAEVSLKGKRYVGGKDYYNFPGQTEQRVKASEILFLGYGIEETTYNDYKDMDVKDKVILILSGEPYKDSVSLISGKKTSSLWTSYQKVKTEKARERGASAVLFVVDDVDKNMEANKHKLESTSMKLDLNKKEMPVIYISASMANEILQNQGLEKLRKSISDSGKPRSQVIKAKLDINIKNSAEIIQSENVLGYVEGSDLKDELIVITAHYDHLGKEGDVVYNGADDDGSGTVAVIELAKTFALAKKEGKGPRRSILFMAVAGEEKGLLGSSYYVDHAVFPLKSTVCNLNIDMIGRIDERHKNGDYVYLIGSDKLSSDLHRISETANKTYSKLELDYTYNDEKDRNRFYYRSDHYNFAKNGIPVIFYFNGVHADYHKETDEVEKIDFIKMEKITRLVFFTAWDLANRTERIVVDSSKK